MSAGEATVTASAGGFSASCRVTVSENFIAVTGVALDRTELSLETGQTALLTATVEPADATDKTVEWSSSDETIVTVSDGTVTAVSAGEATVTASAGGFSASCRVTVSENFIAVTGVALDRTELSLETGQTALLTATVEPADATDKTVEWSSSDETIVTVSDGTVTAVSAGEATVTASAGGFSAACTVTVSAPVPPKIGDYFYSDGTWSDGGLVSIEPDGLNPVWSEPKPAPKAGKEVIGIVFQTFPDRIAQSDRDAGYAHGYVMAVKNAHSSTKQTTAYSLDTDFDCLRGAKNSDTWYQNVNGYEETMTVRRTYGTNLAQCPAFDWTVTDFPLAAPENTSGWFLPSTGQLWDMIANLCGHEVAVHMKDWSTRSLNAGWGYASETVGYDVIARFNASMSMIPSAGKEEMFVTSSEYYSTCSIWASTPCTVGETACVINIGTKGTIELYEEYADGDCVARPILAF